KNLFFLGKFILMSIQRKTILLTLLLICFLPGCGIFAAIAEIFTSDEMVDPKINLEDKQVMIIPFQDDAFPYYESERGTELAKAIVQDVELNKDYTSLAKIFVGNSKELKDYIHYYRKHLEWKKVGELGKADYVVYGKINEFNTQGNKNVGFYQGRGEAIFWVYDAKKGRHVLEKTVKTRYPSSMESSVFPPSMNEAEIALKIENGLLKALAHSIGKEFYTHKKAEKKEAATKIP
ncbi:MAG: hypothetical protein D6785_08935, partial [Planctomycetota bacterium]